MKRAVDVWRGRGETASFVRYELEIDAEATLLDALELIRTGSAPDLGYRHSCHHGSCGTCTVRLDGREVLACITNFDSLYTKTPEHIPRVEALAVFAHDFDLVIDPALLFRSLPENKTHLKESETLEASSRPSGIEAYTRFEDCIECGACVSVCPVMSSIDKPFMGPAALAAIRRESINRPERKKQMYHIAAQDDGFAACERHLDCSRVCPQAVYPAKHIALLKRDIESPSKQS
ncbi:2Fe-2S iron-sulfur cluster-binding protein [Treponema sp.]